jgi:hypothetical protein
MASGAALFLAVSCVFAGGGICLGEQHPTPRPAPPPHLGPKANGPKPNQEHLAQWMQHHQNLSPEEQQRALEAEPGFRQLPPQTQQRMRERLAQLNAMPPDQRSRTLERAEWMERLNAQQKGEVRGAMAQLGRLPNDRRRIVARAFRDLRAMPQSQRQAYLSSDYLQRQLSPPERETLMNLMAVEPMLPPQRPQELPALPPPQ